MAEDFFSLVEEKGLLCFSVFRQKNLDWMDFAGLYNLPVFDCSKKSRDLCHKISYFAFYNVASNKEPVLFKVYTAKFKQEISREQLLKDYPEYPNRTGKAHAENYFLFEIRELCGKCENILAELKHVGVPPIVYLRDFVSKKKLTELKRGREVEEGVEKIFESIKFLNFYKQSQYPIAFVSEGVQMDFLSCLIRPKETIIATSSKSKEHEEMLGSPCAVGDLSNLIEKEDVDFRNCDYKDLVLYMRQKKIMVDLLLTDPPYCVSRKHQLGFSNMGRSGMNYGDWDYDFDQKEWINDCAPLIKEGGSILIFNDWKNASYVVEALVKNGFSIKDLIRWEKKNPMPRNVNSRYVMDLEVIIWAVKGQKKWTFNKPASQSYLKPVYESGLVLGKSRIHPTQKNLSVIESLLKVHSNERDLVFDPFAGSATTAVACLNLNRRFVGSEIDEKYFKKAQVRIYDNQSN